MMHTCNFLGSKKQLLFPKKIALFLETASFAIPVFLLHFGGLETIQYLPYKKPLGVWWGNDANTVPELADLM